MAKMKKCKHCDAEIALMQKDVLNVEETENNMILMIRKESQMIAVFVMKRDTLMEYALNARNVMEMA